MVLGLLVLYSIGKRHQQRAIEFVCLVVVVDTAFARSFPPKTNLRTAQGLQEEGAAAVTVPRIHRGVSFSYYYIHYSPT